eukprot:CAMPEP_0174735926 /NCGR_PEP_ID=MMETSP1094-20130205/65806_1 /TAXON_ID=156173 /ORGANISM="Chrysochromulina brevifilum, Strain UTEX LB 985" /LENGTH=89 /DNA_ID=CAMNT_0015938953 /DNA_START=37 /DNA_END=302 /DNA_ORIENTATION=+
MGCGASKNSNAAPPLRDPLYGAPPEQQPSHVTLKHGYTASEPLVKPPAAADHAPQATAPTAPPAPALTSGVSFTFAAPDGKSSIQTTAT